MKRKKSTSPTRREALTALESVMWALLVWRGSWDSAIEQKCYEEIRRLADESFKRLGAGNMLTLQQAVLNLLKEHTDGPNAVAGVPATPREERPVPREPLQGEEVGLPEPRRSGVEDGAEDEVARGAAPSGAELDDP